MEILRSRGSSSTTAVVQFIDPDTITSHFQQSRHTFPPWNTSPIATFYGARYACVYEYRDVKFIFLQLWAERCCKNLFPEGSISLQYSFLLIYMYIITNGNGEFQKEAGYFEDVAEIDQSAPVFT